MLIRVRHLLRGDRDFLHKAKIVTERLKKDIIKLVIDEVVIEGESVKIFATIPLPNKIHEREMDKTDIPGTFNAGATLGPVNETNMARIWNKHKQPFDHAQGKANTPLKRKVFVGLSGGVDSSVSAALLVEQNYDVTGVFIKVWDPFDSAQGKPSTLTQGRPELQDKLQKICTWRDDRRDAMRVAAKLGIPFKTIDLSAEYKQGVVDYMIAEYKAGRTPNPDVMCNKMVKFGAFYDWAIEQGADYVATGHYSGITRIMANPKSQIPNDKQAQIFKLQKGKDKLKDQSYFLWNLKPEHLAHTLFPIGDYEKSQVRELARKFALPTAEKKDSQGLCFIGKLDVKDFLKEFLYTKKGEVVNEEGKVIGEHNGATFFTIGERHGFLIKNKTPDDKAYYVVAKDIIKNRLVVSAKAQQNISQSSFVNLEQTNWIDRPPTENKNYTCRFRYRQALAQCCLEKNRETWVVKFEVPQASLTSGQSLVVYDNEICLGGGVIV